jgi:PEP-CTERM motif
MRRALTTLGRIVAALALTCFMTATLRAGTVNITTEPSGPIGTPPFVITDPNQSLESNNLAGADGNLFSDEVINKLSITITDLHVRVIESIDERMSGDGGPFFKDVVPGINSLDFFVGAGGTGIRPGDHAFINFPSGFPPFSSVFVHITFSVPEPSSLALGGTSVLTLLACAWRRRKISLADGVPQKLLHN